MSTVTDTNSKTRPRPGVDTPISIVGHSHTLVVGHAEGPALNCRIWGLFEKFMVQGPDGKPALHPELKDQLVSPLISMVDGSSYLVVGFMQHPRAYDFIVPDRPDLPLTDGAEIIPYSLVEDALMAWSEHGFLGMRLLREAVEGPMFHMEGPPPFVVEQSVPDSDLWRELTGGITEVSPPHLRYKLWWTYGKLARTFCAAHNITYITHPPECLDENGYLKQEFWGTPAHGNLALGSIVRSEFLRHVA